VRVSKPHNQLLDFVGSLGVDTVINDRSVLGGMELDIFIPEKSVAIEVDGAYWHSFLGKRYHQEKQDAAEARGVTLLQFFDYEILEKPDIVRSMVSHALGHTEERIYGRKTKLVELSSSDYRNFLRDNHLQGAVNSKTKLGLTHEGNLVSVLGLSTRRGIKTIDRFVSKVNTQVIGGFSKLLSAVPDSVIRTHSANRYATGNVYASNGFSLVGSFPYTLYFTYRGKLYPREKFQKHKISSVFPEYDGEDAETFLKSRGVAKVFAAGTKTWEIRR